MDKANNKILDMDELDRHLGSIQYTIPTKAIMDLKSKVEEWISMNECGAIVFGEARAGKTRAIHYLSEHLRDKYGSELPIYTLCATDHIPTQKTFYSSLLMAIGHEEAHKGSAVQLRQRIVNRIIVNALDTKYRRAVLFVDEAYLLSDKEYTWLIDIYNELNLNDILFTVFLFGTEELKRQKRGYISSGKKQIVLRFMVNEFEFMGITNQRDAVICLSSIDKPFSIKGYEKEIILSELFFPMAYSDGRKLSSYAGELWEAFNEIIKQNKINTNQVLMKHFMDAVFYCMKVYGAYGKGIYAPTKREWIESITESGFIISQI